MDMFHLHSRLEADTTLICDWGLSRVLLMNDARFPWLILVPRRAGLSEAVGLIGARRRAQFAPRLARRREFAAHFD